MWLTSSLISKFVVFMLDRAAVCIYNGGIKKRQGYAAPSTVPLLRHPALRVIFLKQSYRKKGYASLRPDHSDFAKNQRLCAFAFGCRSCVVFKLNRSANYGTTNKSASAGFFVSPKTKNRPGYTPSRPENSEIHPFYHLTFIPFLIQ